MLTWSTSKSNENPPCSGYFLLGSLVVRRVSSMASVRSGASGLWSSRAKPDSPQGKKTALNAANS